MVVSGKVFHWKKILILNFKLQKTAARIKELDVEIQSACDRFSECMYEKFEVLNENLLHLRNQQRDYSNEISFELTKIVYCQAKLSEITKDKIYKINSLCNNFSTTSSSFEEVFSNSLKEFNNEHHKTLLLTLEETRKKEQSFRQEIKESLYSLDFYNKQKNSVLSNMRLRIIEQFTSSNSELQKHTEKINSAVNEIKQRFLDNLQELQKLSNSLSEKRSLMEEEEKIRNVLQQIHLQQKDSDQRVSDDIKYLDNDANTVALSKEYDNNEVIELQSSFDLVERDISKNEQNIDESAATLLQNSCDKLKYLDNCQRTIIDTAENTIAINKKYDNHEIMQLQNSFDLVELGICKIEPGIMRPTVLRSTRN